MNRDWDSAWTAMRSKNSASPSRPDRPEPPRLIETTWPSGKKMYIANTGEVNFMLTHGQQGKIPFYVRGAKTRLVPNDGSGRWKELYQKSRKEPAFVME